MARGAVEQAHVLNLMLRPGAPGNPEPLLYQRFRGVPAPKEGHDHSVNGAAFAPDGQTLASVSHDGAVKLWRAPKSPSLP
jgi:WD40 repeat protein